MHGETSPITRQTVIASISVNVELDKKLIKKKLKSFCKDNMEAYKVPTKFKFVDATEHSNRFKKVRGKIMK